MSVFPNISILALGVAEQVERKSEHMAQIDPHGFTVTIISVVVVFLVLLLLFIAYKVSGYFFVRKHSIHTEVIRLRKLKSGPSAEEVAAIAVALQLYLGQDSVHDSESGIITIKR